MFCFLKRFHIGYKQVVSTLVLIYVGKPRPEYMIKTNFITINTVNPERYSILTFYKSVCG